MKAKHEIERKLENIQNHPAFKSGKLSDSTNEHTFGIIYALEWVLEMRDDD